jgi:hypothetical protein
MSKDLFISICRSEEAYYLLALLDIYSANLRILSSRSIKEMQRGIEPKKFLNRCG